MFVNDGGAGVKQQRKLMSSYKGVFSYNLQVWGITLLKTEVSGQKKPFSFFGIHAWFDHSWVFQYPHAARFLKSYYKGILDIEKGGNASNAGAGQSTV